MIDELNAAIKNYRKKWQKLVGSSKNPSFFKDQMPTAIAWKVKDFDQLAIYFNELCDGCDQVHWGWVNERWLVTLHLKDQKLEWGIQIVKLMQRRPGSKDPVGLDHVDFYSKENSNTETILKRDKSLKWTEESNSANCRWISLWFDGTEAKLRTDTVLEPCIIELKETQSKILAKQIDKS